MHKPVLAQIAAEGSSRAARRLVGITLAAALRQSTNGATLQPTAIAHASGQLDRL